MPASRTRTTAAAAPVAAVAVGTGSRRTGSWSGRSCASAGWTADPWH
jgi:hypothetical protein